MIFFKNRAPLACVPAAVLALLGGMSVGAAAQTAELDTVIVSATRVPQELSDVLPSASVITRQQIERSQAPTLVDLIQSQPGIEIGRNGGPGTLASIFMRGQSSSNVAVFIDGVPLQRNALGGLNLVDIPPSQIERVEILRGNMGALYGESAVGGAILIFTRSAASMTGPTASLAVGSRSSSELTAGYNLSHDSWRMGISLQRLDTRGYSAMNPGQNASVNPDKDGFERESVFVSAEKTLSNNVAVGVLFNEIGSQVEYDSAFNPSFGSASPSDVQNSRQQSSDITVYSRFNLAPDWSSRLSLTQSSFENREFYNGAPNGSFDGDQENLGWSNTYRLGHGHLAFGAEAANARFKTPASYQRESSGYHLGYRGQQARLDYQLNLRRDEIASRSASAASRESASTWLIGLGYWLTDDWKLTGLASTAFRAPHVGELFDTSFTTGNPNLVPEKHRAVEVGITNKSPLGLFRVVRFQSTTRNAIEYRSGPPDYFNIGKVQNKGFEVSLQGEMAGWTYQMNAVTQDPRNAVNGTRLARRAKGYGSLALGKAAMGVDWDAQVVWSGHRVDGVRVLPSYAVLNLTAAKKLTTSWTARVRLENVFDRNYQLAYGYDAVPRGLFLTLQYQPR